MSLFQSSLMSKLSAFVEHKRTLGHKYDGEIKLLRSIDRFVAQNFPEVITLNEDVIRSFLVTLPVPSRSNAVTIFRQFGRFLASDDPTAFVAPPKYFNVHRRRPTIRVFTLGETRLFVDATKLISNTKLSPMRSFVQGMALRTLLFTGLRSGELLSLRDIDVDLHDDIIMVRNGKFGKSRNVPVSRAFAKSLREYRSELMARISNRLPSDAFFPGPDGRRCTCKASLYNAFRDTLVAAGIQHGGRGKGPRVHDLRHTFAVLRLLSWYRQGKDLNAMLPLLATYLGHIGILSTQIYLHLTEDLVGEVTKLNTKSCVDIITSKDRFK